MEIIFAVLFLPQYLKAIFLQDTNQIAYLHYLWSNHIGHRFLSGGVSHRTGMGLNYSETKPEAINDEYPLLIER